MRRLHHRGELNWKWLTARRRSRQLIEFLQRIELARLALFVPAALRLLLAFLMEILIADDLADGLFRLASDPLTEALGLAHGLPPGSRRHPGA
jgi:hypothetical protein